MDNSLVGEMIMAPVPFLRAKDFFLITYVYFSVSDPDPDPHVLPGPHPDPQKNADPDPNPGQHFFESCSESSET